jgi:DNA damage-binding protein 1
VICESGPILADRHIILYSSFAPSCTTMKIVTTFHQPSSVLSSVKCQLSSRDLEHLVIAKINRIDVYSLQPHGLQHECGLEIWGKVTSVKAVTILVRS